MTRSGFRAALSGAVAALALTGLAGCEPKAGATVGEPASELTALTLDGEPVRLEAYRGKVVLINFWSGGCGPCLAEMPEIDALYREMRGQGFEIVALNSGDTQAEVAGISRRLQLSFPLLVDSLKITASRYEVIGVPTSFLVDREGRIAAKVMGPFDGERLADQVGALL